ncbi:hypothetical protein [Ammoniphilus sp. 3BR4]|uniref:hypothetical protein n=1 Tax=Ammoniphilus sp. 3BR4 TaxID=3158265 RepID=UPI003467D91E
MNYYQQKLYVQIKEWNAKRDELDDAIDLIYELIDRNDPYNRDEFWHQVKMLSTQRDKLDDLIDLAYEQIDKYLYNEAI